MIVAVLVIAVIVSKMSFKAVAYFCLVVATTVIQAANAYPSSDQDNRFNVSNLPEDAGWFLDQPEFQNFLQSLPSSRSGRTLLEPEPDLPECGGKFMSLNPGDTAVIKSHKSFGLTPYPSDYLVCKLFWAIQPIGLHQL